MRDTIILIIDAGLESGRPMFSVLSGSQFMRASFCVLRFQMPLRFGDHFLVPLLMLGFPSWNLYGIFNLKLENYILLVLEMLEIYHFSAKMLEIWVSEIVRTLYNTHLTVWRAVHVFPFIRT